MAQKPSIPKGTRDFSPAEVAKRNYIFSTIKTNFEKFGFQPIETPSFENSETLMGKYGEEGDRLIFKILDSGDYFEKATGEKYLGEKQANYLSLYLYSAIEDLFERNKEDIGNSDFEQLINDGFIGVKNRFLIYLKDEKLKDYVSKFIINNKLYFHASSKTINQFVELQNASFKFAFNTFYVSEFLKGKIYNDFISGLDKQGLNLYDEISSKQLTPKISEKALRYDLTVPFARYVVQHQNEIEFPFKRYQIQPVWRADRPQKGRFREFYQCDADVVGSNSLWQEVELVQLYDSVFSQLGLGGVTIKINNRKILSGIAEVIGASDKLIDFTVALDKLDKIGEDGVKKEMLEKGISETAIEKVQPLFNFTGTINEKIEKLAQLLANSDEGKSGVNELQFICDNVTTLGLQTAFLDLDVTLARGLNYYTGAIFEVAAPKGVAMGSIGGGGRYDDLTGIFDAKNKMSGVGISFGLDRIALVMEEVGLFPEAVLATSKALFLNFGDKEALYAMKAIGKLRQKGIKVELYPDKSKIDKQFKHADRRGIPFAVIVGESEIEREEFGLKNLATGEQQKVDFATLVTLLQ
jgi:histidyl-tRNA synthetase